MSSNAPNISWTDDDRVARWLARAPGLERQLEPVADVLFDAAALRPGERVLDVGCGTGPTTRRAARAVGPTGRVAGLDISADMLAAAAAGLSDRDGAAPVEWITADAATWAPPAAAFDVVLSRFGVMFFDDPHAAFSRLAAATRPGGRLAMAVWARRDESPLFAVPLHAALDELRRRGTPAEEPSDDDGAYSLHDPATVTTLLTAAGWTGVTCAPHRVLLPLAGGADPRRATEAIFESGPLNSVTADLDGPTRAAVGRAIAEALAGHVDPAGHVRLHGQVLLVTARVPGATG